MLCHNRQNVQRLAYDERETGTHARWLCFFEPTWVSTRDAVRDARFKSASSMLACIGCTKACGTGGGGERKRAEGDGRGGGGKQRRQTILHICIVLPPLNTCQEPRLKCLGGAMVSGTGLPQSYNHPKKQGRYWRPRANESCRKALCTGMARASADTRGNQGSSSLSQEQHWRPDAKAHNVTTVGRTTLLCRCPAPSQPAAAFKRNI